MSSHARSAEKVLVAAEGTPPPSPRSSAAGHPAPTDTDRERALLEQQMIQSQKMEAIGQLAGGIAHDFNNLLTVITTCIQLIKMTELPERTRALLGEAERASARGAELVKQLLAFVRRSPVEMRPVNPLELVQEVVQIIRNTFDRRIEITVRQGAAVSHVLADPGQMHQVLLNLCVNARDALEAVAAAGDPRPLRLVLTVENTVVDENQTRTNAEACAGAHVRISVADNGCGMDSATATRIFEPFFTTKERGKGTGLGLSTAYGIVKQHRGWIEVQSQPGRGTTFQIYLPTTQAPVRAQATPSPFLDLPGGTETILLADDEEMIRATTQTLLEMLGYRALLAADGQECLEIYAQRRGEIHLIIADVSMPRLSGFDVMKRIRATDPAAKIVLTSGYSETNLGRKYLQRLGAAGFIAKPFEPQHFARTVRDVLDA